MLVHAFKKKTKKKNIFLMDFLFVSTLHDPLQMMKDQSERIRRQESSTAAVPMQGMPQHKATVYLPDNDSIRSEVL